jgi:hypothetical protein
VESQPHRLLSAQINADSVLSKDRTYHELQQAFDQERSMIQFKNIVSLYLKDTTQQKDILKSTLELLKKE